MKYAIFLVVLVVAVFFLRHRRRVVRERRERYSRPLECSRVFKPGTDPFDPKERIEFYTSRK